MNTGEIRDNDYCFACGELNPLGLHLKFAQEGQKLMAACRPGPHHQGFGGIVHGGIIATILDDVMNNLVTRLTGKIVVTADLTVRLRHPAPVGEMLTAEAEMMEQHGRVFRARAALHLATTGELIAESESRMMEVSGGTGSPATEAD